MSGGTADAPSDLIEDYLDRLLVSLSGSPRQVRHSLAEVEAHLRDAVAEGVAAGLPEGTVYPALHRLEGAGLLASGWDVVAGRRRRIYHLTMAGEAALAEQAAQWREFSGSMTRVLGASALATAGGMA